MSTRQLHNLEMSDVWPLLRSGPDGLDAATVEARRVEFGANVFATPRRHAWAKLMARQLTNFFSLLLTVSAALCFVAERMQPRQGMVVLGWALAVVALLNAVFTFAQAMRADRAMRALSELLPPTITVRRGGVESPLPASELVPGDVVRLTEGDRIPADARLFESRDLLVNNAALTGESRHVALRAGAAPAGRLVDAPNLVFAGSFVVRGSGAGVVYATGRHTEFGKIAVLSVEVPRPPTPLEREVSHMVRVLTVVATVLGVAFFLYGLWIGRPLWVNVVFMLGIIVANVPEGLLPTLTLALAMGGLRLARRKVLVRSLNAVEALGAVDAICTDKTGTLTRNELAVTSVVDPSTGAPCAGAALRSVLEVATAASEIHAQGARLTGDPLDVAVALELRRLGGEPIALMQAVVRQIAFDAERRRSAGIICQGGASRFALKGAWEVVRPHVRASPDDLASCDVIVQRLAGRGQRIIAVASRPLRPDESDAPEVTLERELTLHGFLCLSDPLRDEVPAALSAAHRAGIEVILITGDHPETARAIAEQAGILAPGAAADAVLTGDRLETSSEDELSARLDAGVRVFARTTPDQKLKIVAALKRRGRLVAMTGDGVNDAPALRAADVGIAMGLTGTEVAREAAQVVLLDDNFASIVAAVEEGRTVFANIRKFTSYVLTSNVPEILPLLVYVVLPVPLALSVLQILCIDLGTDLVPAIGLGQEPPDGDVMERPPRGLRGRLLDRGLLLRSYLFLGLIQAAWSLGMFFLALHLGGWRLGDLPPPDDPVYRGAMGLTLVSVIFLQIANLVGRRQERRSGLDRGLVANPLFVAGVGLELAFAYGTLWWTPLSNVLGTGPVAPWLVGLAALGAPLLFLLDLARKGRLPETPRLATTPTRPTTAAGASALGAGRDGVVCETKDADQPGGEHTAR